MGSEFPVLFAPENAENLYIFRDGDRIVSHVGVLRQKIVTMGIEIPVACIGSVCTDPDYRGRGLASQLMELAIRRSVELGDVLMYISGGRGLYRRLGATPIGPGIRFKVTPEVAQRIGGADRITVRQYADDDWQALRDLQRLESPCWLWNDHQMPKFLSAFFRHGGVGLLAVSPHRPVAALFFYKSGPMHGTGPGMGRVVQFIGDVRAMGNLLQASFEQHGLSSLDWRVVLVAQRQVATTLLTGGALGQVGLTGWTVLILNPSALAESFSSVASRLSVVLGVEGGGLRVSADGHSALLATPQQQVEGLFCDAAVWSPDLASLGRDLRVAMAGMLPIPLPDYGLNYI